MPTGAALVIFWLSVRESSLSRKPLPASRSLSTCKIWHIVHIPKGKGLFPWTLVLVFPTRRCNSASRGCACSVIFSSRKISVKIIQWVEVVTYQATHSLVPERDSCFPVRSVYPGCPVTISADVGLSPQ